MEAKIKMNSCINAGCSYIFIAAKVKTEGTNKIMLELLIVNEIIVTIRILSETFRYNQVWKQDQDFQINLYIMGRPFSMYIIISMHTNLILQ